MGKLFEIGAILLCVSCQFAYSATIEDIVTKIRSSQLAERRNAVNMARTLSSLRERERVASSVCSLLYREHLDTSFEGSLHVSIRVLGQMKLGSTIPSLLPYFAFAPEGYRVEERMSTEMHFPAARALVNIGKPSIKYMEAILQDSESSVVEMKLAAWVTEQVLGQKEAIEKLSKLKKARKLPNGQTVQQYLKEREVTFVHPGKLSGWAEGVLSFKKADTRLTILALPRLRIEGAKVSDKRVVRRIAFDAYKKRMQSKVSSTDSIQDVRTITLGYDVPEFASKGDRLWEARIVTAKQELQAIVWVNPQTGGVCFVCGAGGDKEKKRD